MVRASRVGFGTGPFGDFRFGWGDWAEIVLVKYAPSIYFEEDDKRPLREYRKWINGIKPVFQELREALEFFPSIRDPGACPIAVLPFLANDIGYVDDVSQTEDRRRSAVFDAWQLYLNKGTARGYAIIGAFNNVDITVDGVYEDPCGSEVLTDQGPDLFQLHIDDVPADVLDRMFDDFLTGGGETTLSLRFNSVFTPTAPTLLAVTKVTISDTSEKIVTTLVLGVDYAVNLVTGVVTLLNQPAQKTFVTVGGEKTFTLDENALTAPTVVAVDSVTLNGVPLVAGVDYTTNIAAGTVTLTNAAAAGATYVIAYHTNGARRGMRYRVLQDVNVFMDLFSPTEDAFWPLTGDVVPESFTVQLTFLFPAVSVGMTLLTLPYRSLTDPALVSIDAITKNGNPLIPVTDYATSLPTGEVRLLQPNGVPSPPTSDYAVTATVSGIAPRCRTSLLRVSMSRIPGASSVIPAGVNDIIAKISQFKPIHVAFESFSYDTSLPLSYRPRVSLTTRPLLDTVAPNTGPAAGGTAIIIKGNEFIAGTLITIGGNPLVGLTIIDINTITGTTPAGVAGAANVVATSSNGSSTLVGGFTYV